ncbi:MAG: ABC transporter substrate-binding protein [Chlorobaculum sp.]|nr:ABC transporter substrate-binding protein [Chlorobaculum sp.]
MKKIYIFLAFILTALSLTGCSKSNNNSNSIKVKNIAVLKLGQHPVIDTVVKGFEERFENTFKDKVKISVFSANFDGKTLSVLSKELVASDYSLLVGVTTPASGQLIGAARGIKPIVFTFASDLKALGYRDDNSLPNTTGLSDQVDYERTLLMMREFVPKAKRIGYIVTRSESNAVLIQKGFIKNSPQEGFEVISATIGNVSDIRKAAELLAQKVDVFLVGGDNTLASGLNALIDVARVHKIPVFANDESSVEKGAIAAYSVDYRQMGSRTADMCALILAGAKPEDVPVEIFHGTKLVINLQAAAETGVNVPIYFQKAAYRVIR